MERPVQEKKSISGISGAEAEALVSKPGGSNNNNNVDNKDTASRHGNEDFVATSQIASHDGADNAAEAASKQLQVQQPAPLSPFEQLMLDSHNYYRAHHSAPPLKPCAELAKRAQYWASTLASNNNMYHERQDWDGENLAMKWNSCHSNFPATDFVNMWYYEAQNYRFPDTLLGQNSNARNCVTGHFSQLVWKKSQRVGFGRAVSKTGRVFVVARYRPPGNWSGWFKVNVLPPIDGKLALRFRRQ